MIQSQSNGRFYATVCTCNVSSTFDEAIAKRIAGQSISGSIVRVPCEEYEYTVPGTGEVVKLGYTWDYVPC